MILISLAVNKLNDSEDKELKLALNGATTMKADLTEDIRAASAAVFDYLEIWASKHPQISRVRDHTGLSILRPSIIYDLTHQFHREHHLSRPDRARATFKRVRKLCRIASEINCPYIVVSKPYADGKSQADVWKNPRERSSELGRIAEASTSRSPSSFSGNHVAASTIGAS